MINIPVIVSLVIIFTLIIVIGFSVLILGYIYWNFLHKRVRIIKFCENDDMKLSEALEVFEVNNITFSKKIILK